MLVAVILFAVFAVAHSHLCLINPYQRGAPVTHADFDKAGADVCGLTAGPCGGVNASNTDEYQIFGQGERVNIVMQKNLDHFAAGTPGNFTVGIRNDKEHHELGSIADDKSPSGSLYPIVVNIPKEAEGRYVLEAIYFTNNANAPAKFYQCADVAVASKK